jgi:hypothetical protein
MLERIATGLLAAAVFLSSGITGAVSYLCLMDGQTRPTCCCQGTEDRPAAEECIGNQRPCCCEVQFSDVPHPPATVKASGWRFEPLHLVAMLSPMVRAPRPDTREAESRAGARGPPPANDPSLFVRDCRYLI